MKVGDKVYAVYYSDLGAGENEIEIQRATVKSIGEKEVRLVAEKGDHLGLAFECRSRLPPGDWRLAPSPVEACKAAEARLRIAAEVHRQNAVDCEHNAGAVAALRARLEKVKP